MRIELSCFNPYLPGLLLLLASQAYSQELLRKNVPVIENVTLTTLADDDSIKHRVTDQGYEIEIVYSKSMLGTAKLTLTVEDVEPGKWSPSELASGSLVTVKPTGNKEPRGCVAEPAYGMKKDPAGDFVAETIKRIGGQNGVPTPAAAKSEIDRLVNQYGQTEHVLKLPRSAASRLNPNETLKRLCRWIAYDKLFKHVMLDTRPVATETDATETYEQVVDVLRGNPLPDDETEHRISEEEFQRIKDAFQFTYSVRFVPYLTPDQPDQNWRQANRFSFVDGRVGGVLWSGELHQDQQSTAWLAFRAEDPDHSVNIKATNTSKDCKWVFVDGKDGWRYLRLRNLSNKASAPFQLRVSADGNGPEVSVTSNAAERPRFPF